MGRLVEPTRTVVKPPCGGREGMEFPAESAEPLTENGDTYLVRVAKYVPAEIVAFFIFANLILKQADKPGATMAGLSVVTISMVVFVGAWLATPVYLARVAEAGDAWVTNAVMATLLFPVWAYAVEGVGPVHILPFDGNFASLVLGTASLVSGLVTPRDRVPSQGRNGNGKLAQVDPAPEIRSG